MLWWKLFAIIVILSLLTGNCSSVSDKDGTTKIVKVLCSASNKTSINRLCRLKPISRVDSLMSFEYEFLKPTRNFFASAIMSYKTFTGQTYRQIFEVKNLEVCKLTKMIPNMGFLGDILKTVNETLKGIIQPCPYQGKISIMNATFRVNSSDPNDKWIKLDRGRIPNGNYKVKLHAFNKDDDNIATITVFWNINQRFNTVASNDQF